MTLKAGYIGTGGISGKHLNAMAAMEDKVTITALCDVFEDAAKARAEQFGGNIYTDYKKMLDDEDLDIAFICVPPDSHADIEVRCAEKGLLKEWGQRTRPESTAQFLIEDTDSWLE